MCFDVWVTSLSRCCVQRTDMNFHTHQVLVVVMNNGIQIGLQHSDSAESVSARTMHSETKYFALTSEQFGLTVDKLWFPGRAVALAGVVKNLDKGAFLSSWTRNPLVESIVEQQVKLWTVLVNNQTEFKYSVCLCVCRREQPRVETYFIGVNAVDLSELVNGPLWPFYKSRRSLELLHLG